jgi:hypothetical protein
VPARGWRRRHRRRRPVIWPHLPIDAAPPPVSSYSAKIRLTLPAGVAPNGQKNSSMTTSVPLYATAAAVTTVLAVPSVVAVIDTLPADTCV